MLSVQTPGLEAQALLKVARFLRRHWPLLTGLLLIVLVFDQVRRVGDFRVDDAYITFSFSKNLATGNGPVYGHGMRVEGYSNFLWMVLVSAGYRVYPNLYLVARVLSFVLLAGCFAAVYSAVRISGSRMAACIAVVFLACCSDLVRGALSGLETTAFTAALALGWMVYLRENPQRRRWSLSAFLPVALLRIDGFVPMLVVIGFEFLSALFSRRFRWTGFIVWAAPAVSIWCVYFAWRFGYYELPLPTTYYAKSNVAGLEPGRGWNQLWDFLEENAAGACLPVMLVPLIVGPRWRALGLWTAVLCQLAYAAKVGGDWMPFSRFNQPVMPLVAILAGWGVARLFQGAQRYRYWLRPALWGRTWRFSVALSALGLLAHSMTRMHMAWVDSRSERDKLQRAEEVKHHTNDKLVAAMDLAQYVIRKPGERFVTDYAGVFAVFTRATVIDMWGLANAQIALHGGFNDINPIYGKECARCYPSLQPDYFHVTVPLIRTASAFSNQKQIVSAIFQSGAIGHYLDLRGDFAAGYVLQESTGRAFWFLERKRPGLSFAERRPAPDVRVVYPFNPEQH